MSWLARNWVVEIAVALSFLYMVLQIVALGQLTGERRMTGMKYLVVAMCAVLFVIDWLIGATGWAAIEAFVAIVILPFAVGHLAILLIQESRQS